MIETVATTGSTNADLAARLRDGETLADGYWLVADRQTAGRGRQGRAWSDGLGNFMGSCVVHLRKGDPPAPTLSFVTAHAVFDAVGPLLSAMNRLQLKWPNDVILNGGKVAGILLERVADAVVIGIGVNLVSAPDLPDRPTSSIARAGARIDRDSFAQNLAAAMDTQVGLWREQFGLQTALASFLYRSQHQIGALTTVHVGAGEQITGQFNGLEQSDGALCLRMKDGSERVIRAGDIIFGGD